jgi:hypothetical protein
MMLLEEFGKNAGYISAIVGCLTLVLWKPVSYAWKKRRAKRQEQEKAAAAFQEKVLSELNDIKTVSLDTRDDVSALQCDRLYQAHDYYMEKGFCPTEKKKFLCDMYEAYHAKGLNHLSEHYYEDIIELPDKPRTA